MDLREHNPDDLIEAVRVLVAGIMAQHFHSMPVQVVKDTEDGHVSMVQPLVKRKITDPDDGTVTYLDHPPYPDAPIHHMGGGGVSKTFPNKQGDTGLAIFSDRPLDSPFQSDGTQPPIDDRVHNFADATFLSGFRSIPRMLQQVAKDSAQFRSDDGHHVHDVHPTNGVTTKSVDPSTPPASAAFSPFTDATKFFSHALNPISGLLGQAVDGAIAHTHGIAHDLGAFMTALNNAHSVLAHPSDGASMNAANLLHQVLCHPSNGAAMMALNGLHKVLAHPSIGAALMGSGGASSVIAGASLALQSAGGISFSCPAGSFQLPMASVSAPTIALGAASSNVGTLGGDLAGTLPNPTVVGIANVTNANTLPVAANDSAAAALSPPVPVGGLYRNTTVASGVSVLCVRMA